MQDGVGRRHALEEDRRLVAARDELARAARSAREGLEQPPLVRGQAPPLEVVRPEQRALARRPDADAQPRRRGDLVVLVAALDLDHERRGAERSHRAPAPPGGEGGVEQAGLLRDRGACRLEVDAVTARQRERARQIGSGTVAARGFTRRVRLRHQPGAQRRRLRELEQQAGDVLARRSLREPMAAAQAGELTAARQTDARALLDAALAAQLAVHDLLAERDRRADQPCRAVAVAAGIGEPEHAQRRRRVERREPGPERGQVGRGDCARHRT